MDLSKTDIDNIPLDAFKGLVKLQQIDLSGNFFMNVPEGLSLVGKTLKYLTFNNNPIVELNDDSFVGKSYITYLCTYILNYKTECLHVYSSLLYSKITKPIMIKLNTNIGDDPE